MGLVLAAIVLGAILLVLGIVIKAAKWLIIIAIVVWLVGAVRGFMARRGGGAARP
jgi:hypothetical protein